MNTPCSSSTKGPSSTQSCPQNLNHQPVGGISLFVGMWSLLLMCCLLWF